MSLTRRHFVRLAGSVIATLGIVPATHLAADPDPQPDGDNRSSRRGRQRRKTLVVIFLRGGADGLSFFPPFTEEAYYAMRPTLALLPPTRDVEGEAKCLDLDGTFGIHPQLEPLLASWKSRTLGVVPALGNPRNNRSHFVQQDVWETARVDSLLNADGWLNRYLQLTAEGARGPLRAVSIGGQLPRILRGKAGAQAIDRVEDLAYPNEFAEDDDSESLESLLQSAYEADGGNVGGEAGRRVLEGYEALRKLTRTPYRPAAEYPEPEENPLSQRLMQVARLIKADVGLEVAHVDYDGWDTHESQGWRAVGQFAFLARNFAQALAAFARDLGDRLQDTLVLAISEFGRTAHENGSQGTDHGHGGTAFLLGGGVKTAGIGGKMLGGWPGLGDDDLNEERDLAHTVDFRDLFADVLTGHLGATGVDRIFTGHHITPLKWLAKG